MQDRATTYKLMVDPAMPEGRWHFADERQLGAAFRDNRVIPYEGVVATEMLPEQQKKLLKIVETLLEFLPKGPRAVRLRQVESHLDQTYFSWIGSFGEDDPFYYRVQSPVILLEFDHHSGVWLTNADPAKFHSHVVVRTPNGNDYGKELLRLHSRQQLAEVDREPIVKRLPVAREVQAPMQRAEHDGAKNEAAVSERGSRK
jgi:hypothetical protein